MYEYHDMNGLMICPSMLLDASTPAAQKLILALIDALDAGDGCRISNRDLARITGLSVPTVRKHLALMNENGYIDIEVVGFGDRKLSVACSPWTDDRPRRRAARLAINSMLVKEFGSQPWAGFGPSEPLSV